MNSPRRLLAFVAALTVAGCISSPERTEPPAPVYEKGQRMGDARFPDGEGTVTTAPIGGPEVTVGGAPSYSVTPIPETNRPVAEQAAARPTTNLAYAPRTVQPVTSAQPMGSAARSLVDQADARARGGDLTAAASLLERAVRLEPRHPLPWNHLAHVRFGQGSYALAAELAEKSNALAGKDNVLKRDNWQLIAESRRRAGDADGARAAQRQADGLR
jgi:hypothetical protein